MEFTTRLELRVPDLDDPADRLIDVSERLDEHDDVLLGAILSGSRDTVAVLCQVEANSPSEAVTEVLKYLARAVGYSPTKAKRSLISIECEPYVDPELAEPVSQAEIARRLDLTEGRVHQLVRRPDFPQAIQRVDATRPLFRWGDVKEWNERRLKEARPGRPRRESVAA